MNVFQPLSPTRVLCGALALPIIASRVGDFWFADVTHCPVRRTLYGGSVFLILKGMFGIYFRYQHLVRNMQRVVLDYEEDKSAETPSGSEDSIASSSGNVILFEM
ncbi:unnamed protein product [Soboliphyme baturini]|uniref:Transmembrane protein n=1 Tax=Soboliphyme baturini TaxID=241478 RepID=A0A183J6I7_9BILA|nr:unnamed protein product [Soboliphyme baturini]